MEPMEKKIRDILNEKAEIPNIVLEKADSAYEEIRGNRVKREQRSRHPFRYVSVAAAFVAALLVIGTTALAASDHFSLLSRLDWKSQSVKEQAASLLDTNVPQQQEQDQSQAKWVTFRVREAICDKNQAMVVVEACAADPDRYLLVPDYYWAERETYDIDNFNIMGEKKQHMSFTEYAEKNGKVCLGIDVDIDSGAWMQTVDTCMDADGTVLYTFSFENVEREDNMEFVCTTGVRLPDESSMDVGLQEEEFTFTLTDKTKLLQTRYLPKTEKKIEGTKLVVDQVIFEKSALGMVGKIQFHYNGTMQDWGNTKDADIGFFLYDAEGKEIVSEESTGTEMDEKKNRVVCVQRDFYGQEDLPDTLIVQARDIFTRKEYGKIEVQLVK